MNKNDTNIDVLKGIYCCVTEVKGSTMRTHSVDTKNGLLSDEKSWKGLVFKPVLTGKGLGTIWIWGLTRWFPHWGWVTIRVMYICLCLHQNYSAFFLQYRKVFCFLFLEVYLADIFFLNFNGQIVLLLHIFTSAFLNLFCLKVFYLCLFWKFFTCLLYQKILSSLLKSEHVYLLIDKALPIFYVCFLIFFSGHGAIVGWWANQFVEKDGELEK